MVLGVIVVGVIAQLGAWWLVAVRRASIWSVVAPVIFVAGIAAVVVQPPLLSGDVSVAVAAAAGIASGVVLYGATRAFVALVARPWPAFIRHARSVYAHGDAGLGALAVAAASAVAIGEELFWRGLVQRELSARLDAASLGAAATLGLYALVNAVSRNLALVAGAVVGGAVWGALAWWTGGVLASVLSHATWTALMLVRPAVAAR
jgi:hypothetical protein